MSKYHVKSKPSLVTLFYVLTLVGPFNLKFNKFTLWIDLHRS